MHVVQQQNRQQMQVTATQIKTVIKPGYMETIGGGECVREGGQTGWGGGVKGHKIGRTGRF